MSSTPSPTCMTNRQRYSAVGLRNCTAFPLPKLILQQERVSVQPTSRLGIHTCVAARCSYPLRTLSAA